MSGELSFSMPESLRVESLSFAAAVSLTVESGRITQIYAINNPHKLARLDAEAALTR